MDDRIKILPWDFAIIGDDTHFGRWIAEAGNSDSAQFTQMIAPLIKEGDVVIDAGAYIGDQTIHYSKAVGESGSVFAFEPNPLAFECLCYNTRKMPNVTRFLLGVGGEVELTRLVTADENYGATKLVPGGGILVVPIDILPITKLDFIKLDIEGMEFSALLGAKQTIIKHRPLIYVEVHSHPLLKLGISFANVLDFFDSMNYSVTGMDSQPLPDSLTNLEINPSGMFDALARPL